MADIAPPDEAEILGTAVTASPLAAGDVPGELDPRARPSIATSLLSSPSWSTDQDTVAQGVACGGCTTDHIANPGDWFEHRLGRYSILLVRGDDRCPPGTFRTSAATGATPSAGARWHRHPRTALPLQHRWAWDLAGRLREIPVSAASIRPAAQRGSVAGAGAGGHLGPPAVFVNLDLDAEPLDDWLEGIPVGDIAWAKIWTSSGAPIPPSLPR